MKAYRWLTLIAAAVINALGILIFVAASSSAHADDMQSVSVVTAPVPPEERSHMHLSRTGIGSLSWAVHNPAQAWRVVFPVEPGEADGAYADLTARCAVRSDALSGTAACP